MDIIRTPTYRAGYPWIIDHENAEGEHTGTSYFISEESARAFLATGGCNETEDDIERNPAFDPKYSIEVAP